MSCIGADYINQMLPALVKILGSEWGLVGEYLGNGMEVLASY